MAGQGIRKTGWKQVSSKLLRLPITLHGGSETCLMPLVPLHSRSHVSEATGEFSHATIKETDSRKCHTTQVTKQFRRAIFIFYILLSSDRSVLMQSLIQIPARRNDKEQRAKYGNNSHETILYDKLCIFTTLCHLLLARKTE